MNIIKSKKQMFIVIGAFALILLLGTASYAFFNYTRTGGENTVGIGRIYFNTDQGNDTLTLTNIFPMTSSQANTANLDSVAVHIEGDTTYTGGEEFEVTLVNVTNTVNGKDIPINYTATYTASTNKTIGTSKVSDDAYFSDRGSSTTVYNLTSTGEAVEGAEVLKGYIAPGTANGIDGVLEIKAYIDSSKVVISDTYPAEETDANSDGYIDGTPASFGEGKTVLTTTEWNSLTGNNTLSFKIRAVANEGTWILNPNAYAANIKCQRVTDATKLHTENCSQTSNNCAADGYTGDNTLITYGNAKALNTQLAVGDAFDCDVNGDGIINKDGNGNSTERFYYVSEYYNTDTKAFDTSAGYATLIYYSNTINGLVSTSGAAYYASGGAPENWHGPVTAATHLPTTSQWSKIRLKDTSRTILAEGGSIHNSLTTYNGSNTIENPFNYTGKAARLLTAQELMRGCGLTQIDYQFLGSSGCNFLFEGTKYADSSQATDGPWLETPYASSSTNVWGIYSNYRNVGNYVVNSTGEGVRPVIDVAISDIDY